MKTANDWMKELEALYEGQKTGKIKPPAAVEMNNTIGKVINLAKLQLEYQRSRQKSDGRIIAMLEEGKTQ